MESFGDEFLTACGFTAIFEPSGDVGVPGTGSTGFMDLAELEDFGPSMLDLPPPLTEGMATTSLMLPGGTNLSSSSEAVKEDHIEKAAEEGGDHETQKELVSLILRFMHFSFTHYLQLSTLYPHFFFLIYFYYKFYCHYLI